MGFTLDTETYMRLPHTKTERPTKTNSLSSGSVYVDALFTIYIRDSQKNCS